MGSTLEHDTMEQRNGGPKRSDGSVSCGESEDGENRPSSIDAVDEAIMGRGEAVEPTRRQYKALINNQRQVTAEAARAEILRKTEATHKMEARALARLDWK
jgi:hypothetical protein